MIRRDLQATVPLSTDEKKHLKLASLHYGLRVEDFLRFASLAFIREHPIAVNAPLESSPQAEVKQ